MTNLEATQETDVALILSGLRASEMMSPVKPGGPLNFFISTNHPLPQKTVKTKHIKGRAQDSFGPWLLASLEAQGMRFSTYASRDFRKSTPVYRVRRMGHAIKK